MLLGGIHRFATGRLGPAHDESQQREEPLPLEGKDELGQRRALKPERKSGGSGIVGVERYQRSAMRKGNPEDRAAAEELVLVNHRGKRARAAQILQRLRNVLRNQYPMTGSDERLRYAFEKRGVGSNYNYTCHYLMPAPSASACTLSGDTPAALLRPNSQQSQHRALKKAD